mgnify:CR=1 FL=1
MNGNLLYIFLINYFFSEDDDDNMGKGVEFQHILFNIYEPWYEFVTPVITLG